MIEELLIHTGDCKTGSTSIQRVMAREAWSAPGYDICYPTEADHNFVAHTLTREWEAPFKEERFGDLRRDFMATSAPIGLLSSEHMEFVDPVVLRDVIGEYFPEVAHNVRILTYIRPHAERLLSGFAERTKVGGFWGSQDEFLGFMQDERILNYADRVDRWKDVFGDRVTIRPMIRKQLINEDVVDDYFAWALPGVDVEVKRGLGASNASLTVEQLAYLREIHRFIREADPDLVDQQHHLGWQVGDLMGSHGSGPATKLRLHRDLAERIRDHYADDAARLDRDHFGGGTAMADKLTDAVDKAAEAPQSLDPSDYYPPRMLGMARLHAELMMRVMRGYKGRFDDLIEPPHMRRARRQRARLLAERREAAE